MLSSRATSSSSSATIFLRTSVCADGRQGKRMRCFPPHTLLPAVQELLKCGQIWNHSLRLAGCHHSKISTQSPNSLILAVSNPSAISAKKTGVGFYRFGNSQIRALRSVTHGSRESFYDAHLHISPLSRISAQAAVNRSQIASSHASCSGFINTERKQVTVPRSFADSKTVRRLENHFSGNSTRARCKS